MSLSLGNQVETISKLFILNRNKENFKKAVTLKIVGYDISGLQIADFEIPKENINKVKTLIIEEMESQIKILKEIRSNNETKLA